LLFDLLTRDEEEEDMVTAEYRFNIGLLVNVLWGYRMDQERCFTSNCLLGYFGASTGAAAALIAAANFKMMLQRLFA